MECYQKEESPKNISLVGNQSNILGPVLNGPESIKNILSINIPQGAEFQYLHGYIDTLSRKYGSDKEYVKLLPKSLKLIATKFGYKPNSQMILNEIQTDSFFSFMKMLPGSKDKTLIQDRLKLLVIGLLLPLKDKSNEIIVGEISKDLIKDIVHQEDNQEQADALLDAYYNYGNKIAVIAYDKEYVQLMYKRKDELNNTAIYDKKEFNNKK